LDRVLLRKVLARWNIDLADIIHENIPGSPERASDRFVVKDTEQRKYIVEKHHFWNKERKVKIANNIKAIGHRGFSACQPYLVSQNGAEVEEIDNRCWMVQPFIYNDRLLRPDYLDDGEMGRNCACLLIDLKSFWKADLYETVEDFDLKEHTENLIEKLKGSRHIDRDLSQIIQVIKEQFIPKLNAVEKVFSHGDLHPINILWKDNKVKAVIDWEFSGFRHEFTDIANLLGCLGFEHPTAFKRDFFISLMEELDKNDYFSKEVRKSLFLYVFGFRFSAWLNEWHKKNDKKMVELELDYLEILLDNLNRC